MKVGWIESPRKDAFFFAKTTGLLVRGMYLEQICSGRMEPTKCPGDEKA